ncbi:MAG TPA: DUF87 domain-containing protein [Actinomycetes bacterium]|nr:DUF87 domain-containing protein [Actinomycetes bacterium]
MREPAANDKTLFLGRVDPDKVQPSPLVRSWDGAPAAVWSYGPGGAPHMRIVGTTGGGKSSLLRIIERGLVHKPGRRAITIIDAEGAGEHTVMDGMPGVAQIINLNPAADRKVPEGTPTSVELAAGAIADHLTLSVERNEERMQVQQAWLRLLKDPARHKEPAWRPPGEAWLIIDGWATLCQVLARYSKAKADTVEDLTQYGMNGRKTDCHLVVADQVTYASKSKDDDGMPSRLKKQLACSVAAVGALGLTASEGRMAFDDEHAGRLVPRVPGGCLIQVGATRVPFIVPPWLNATDPDAPVSVADRRAAYRLLPSPETAA